MGKILVLCKCFIPTRVGRLYIFRWWWPWRTAKWAAGPTPVKLIKSTDIYWMLSISQDANGCWRKKRKEKNHIYFSNQWERKVNKNLKKILATLSDKIDLKSKCCGSHEGRAVNFIWKSDIMILRAVGPRSWRMVRSLLSSKNKKIERHLWKKNNKCQQ